MPATMDKELLIRLPSSLYDRVKGACLAEYKSMSAFVRELLLEKLDDALSPEEMAAIEQSRKLFKQGKGVSWRKIKRG